MLPSGINGGSKQGWNQTRCILLHLPRMAPAPIGPASRNDGLQTTETTGSSNQIAATRIWTINRRTGDVSYALNGQVSVIDRGRIVTVLNQDKAASSSDWRWPSEIRTANRV